MDEGLAVGEAAARGGDDGGAVVGAAGEGEADIALPGAQAGFCFGDHLQEADIDALREERVPFDEGACGFHVDGVEVGHEEDDVGVSHAHGAGKMKVRGINRPDLEIDAASIHPFSKRYLFPLEKRRAHVDGDARRGDAVGFQLAGDGLDDELVLAGLFHDEPGDASRGVAAGLGGGAIAVPDAHEDVAAERLLHGDDLVGADAGLMVRDGRDLLGLEAQTSLPVVEYDEGIPGPIHLPEFHGVDLGRCGRGG